MSSKLTITIPAWLDRLFVWPLLLYRYLHYGYTFRRIPLGDGIFTIVDQEIYYRLGQFKWSACGYEDNIYAARILRETKFGRIMTMYLHREIMNDPERFLVDHRNGDGLDNRRANLREATHSQNMHNCRKIKNTSSRFRGVSFAKKRGLWETQITNERKKIFLGRFVNEIDAARAYDQAAKKYFGEFARLNFKD